MNTFLACSFTYITTCLAMSAILGRSSLDGFAAAFAAAGAVLFGIISIKERKE